MSPEQHAEEAERLLKLVTAPVYQNWPLSERSEGVALAQLHATLAVYGELAAQAAARETT